eukprot:7183595-Heterocapsa_arctica.AAC.1
MGSGHPEEHIREKRTVMEIVFFVEKRTRESIIYGGNAQRSIDTRTLVTSKLCKSDTESTTNPNVSGMLE